MRSERWVAFVLALLLLVAGTAGALNDIDDDADGSDATADVSDVVTMFAPPALAEYAPSFGSVVLGHPAARDTGRDIARQIFRPPI